MITRRQCVAPILAGAWVVAMYTLCAIFFSEVVDAWPLVPDLGLPKVLGMPPQQWLVRVLCFGIVPAILFRRSPVWLLSACLIAVSVLIHVIAYDKKISWVSISLIIAETLVIFMPAQYFARWTASGLHLKWRATLHALTYFVCSFLTLPLIILELSGGANWHPAWLSGYWGQYLLQLCLIPGILGIAAIREFVAEGRGSPMPWDAPPRLTTTGPYAYLANPMQLTKVTFFAMWALWTGNLYLTALCVFTWLYAQFVALPRERIRLRQLHGARWDRYRANVRTWWPRYKPWIPDGAEHTATLVNVQGSDAAPSLRPPRRLPPIHPNSAQRSSREQLADFVGQCYRIDARSGRLPTLYLDLSCQQCTAIAYFFEKKSTGLTIKPINEVPIANGHGRNLDDRSHACDQITEHLSVKGSDLVKHAHTDGARSAALIGSEISAPKRITYISATNSREHGVTALASACQHINIFWALTGWAIRLPGVATILQCCMDASTPSPNKLNGSQVKR